MTKIAVFVGSIAKESINHKFAKELEALLPEGAEFVYANLDLPLFSVDKEVAYPAEAQANKDLVAEADGILFVTPEYNRSIPGVLKNAIDWASRPWGANSFDGKPAATIGMTTSPLGTAPAQMHLRNILNYLNVTLMGQPEGYFVASNSYDENGVLEPDTAEFAQTFIDAFVAHVEENAKEPALVA